ncbi:hypothetical protein L226DRAFT_280174 [Lentinus tigrinus ALCF2SS1-7]|uniref:Uncharacterized protein n=1 Tax=Lentinus tigrinus ALCF2SS1-6 TaxID=1328759 RepID=A0A5C2RSM5_9APHY|nr:hypothetical protein L227DRAFT_657645 [Lentinus tigrinus ALCF2SS1-6]RPD69292.1 hypothetical protein L226DRAFT_280174 [Lentinus tigrinus ALCF2SS1-7]
MRPFAFAAAVLALCALCANAQTVTTIDELGQTVVEVITVDPLQGLPTTETLQTLTTTATTTTTTPDQGQVGPVGQPAIPGTGLTEYTYTTTDAAGNTQAIVDTFTPTFAPTTGGTFTAPPGTILDYTSWKASVGSNTVAVITSSAFSRWSLHPRWLAVGTALCAAFTGGAWLALA